MATREQRSTFTFPTGGCYLHHYYRWMVLSWLCVRVTAAQNCGGTDVGVVVVASVFGTLAVVALVLGIVYFLLRRRNGGALFPKRAQAAASGRTAEEGDVNDSCYVNAAFSVHDVTDGEQGRKKSSPQKNHSPGKKSLKTDSQKTWVSLPSGQDELPGSLHRQGSCGSLDTNFTSTETVSVWLLSQDIIGLGFNISGNMRDGTYVSQVHSRGPAIESGKVQTGDRILSVTIGFENIVYEDALTILSYASPYPVKLTLQKERTAQASSQSPRKEQLNHPLYRSQSMDALLRMGKDPPFRPQRTRSDIKLETLGRTERSPKAKAISQSYSGYGSYQAARDQLDLRSDVLVHSAARLQTQISADESLDSFSSPWDPQAGEASVDEDDPALEMTSPAHTQMAERAAAEGWKEDTEAQAGRKKSRLDMEAAREFANLMDQVQEAPSRKAVDDTTKAEPGARTAPSKPERKKPSNSSTVSSDESVEAVAVVVGVDDTFQSKGSADAESLSTERVSSPDGFVSVSLSDNTRTVSPEAHEAEEELAEAAETCRVHEERPASSSKGRDHSRESRQKESRRKKEETKPVLSDEQLERLIAMNSFPPGSQGLAGIQAGGKQGGVHDDFLPRDVLQQTHNLQTQAASARRSSSSSEASSQSRARQRGGVAFEVREDVMTGRPVSVDISRSRNSSASPSRSGSRDRIPRVNSMHDPHSHPRHQQGENKENGEEGLGWSGKRLVRAGSFSLIPQDDSLNDWTDKRAAHDDDDAISTESGKPSTADTNPDSESEMDPPRGLPSRDVFKARENLANMSDLSNSVSSSRSSSPPVPNGPSTGGTTHPSSSAGSVTGLKNVSVDVLPSSSEPSGSSLRTVGVRLNSGGEEDMEC